MTYTREQIYSFDELNLTSSSNEFENSFIKFYITDNDDIVLNSSYFVIKAFLSLNSDE